jgi:hypothetical protein
MKNGNFILFNFIGKIIVIGQTCRKYQIYHFILRQRKIRNWAHLTNNGKRREKFYACFASDKENSIAAVVANFLLLLNLLC